MEGRGRRWAWGCGTQREGGQWVGKRGLLAIPGAQWGLLNVTNGTEWGEVASFCPRCPQSPWEALSLGQSEDSEPRAREKLGVGERPGVSSLLFFWGQGTVVLFWFFFFFFWPCCMACRILVPEGCVLSCIRLFANLWALSLRGSPVHEVFQARMLEWVAISSFWDLLN